MSARSTRMAVCDSDELAVRTECLPRASSMLLCLNWKE